MPHVLAFVLVRATSGKAMDAVKGIQKLGAVKEAYAVTGPYDIICKVQAETMEELAKTVVQQIQDVDGVERTETALAVHKH